MVERLLGRAVGLVVAPGQILDMAKVREVHVGAGGTQARRERQHGLLRRHELIALGVRKPQRRLGKGGHVLVRGVVPRGAAGKARGEEAGVVGAQAQRHKAAVGKAGDHDAVGVDAVGMLGDKLVDERLNDGGVDTLVGVAELLDAVVHPKCGRLRHEHPSKAAKVALDLRLANSRHAVADIGARGAFALRGALALAGAVQIHHERGLLGHDCGLGREGIEASRVLGGKAGLIEAVLERDAIDGGLLRGVAPALERGADVAAAGVEDQAAGGIVAVVAGKGHELRDAQLVVEHARAHHAALDLFGQALLGDFECHMGAHGELAATLVARVGGEHVDVAHGRRGVVGAAFLAHQDLARALVALYIYMEGVRVDVIGAHGARQIEHDLADPGAKVTQAGDGCVGARFEFHKLPPLRRVRQALAAIQSKHV